MYIRYPGLNGSIGPGSFPLLAPNGSAAAPSYSFSNFPTSGMYTSSGSVSFSTAGVLAFSVDTTGNFTFGKTTNATTLTLNAPAASLATYVRNANDGGTVISGGTNSSNGGVLELLGGAFGGGLNNRIRFLQAGTEVLSVSQGNVFTIGSSGFTSAHTINGKLDLFSTQIKMNTAQGPAATNAILQGANDGVVVLSGGSSAVNNGGEVYCYGNTHATKANTLELKTNGTLAATIDSNQKFTVSSQLIGKGTASNDNAAAGYIGEYIESIVSSATNVPAATGVWGNMTSISLTAGDWDVTGTCQAYGNGATVVNPSLVAVSIFSGATTTDHVVGSNVLQLAPPGATAGAERSVTVPSYRISLSGTTTVYFKENWTYSVATPQYQCRLSARRVR